MGLCPVREELPITRRNLPHWQIGGSIDFMTFRTKAPGLPSRGPALELCGRDGYDKSSSLSYGGDLWQFAGPSVFGFPTRVSVS